MQIQSQARSFGGRQIQATHDSDACACPMRFSIYLPPAAEAGPVPVIYYLSGLTCTDENVATKGGAQRVAADLGVAVVMPDTSPRGEGVPGDPDGAWDFGLGAGFYVNATQAPWSTNYQMYRYVVEELPALVEAEFNLDGNRRAVFGHSMGGHGALVIALRNPERYRAVSAFSPIVAPSQVPWGHKALGRYLGEDRSAWASYDACALLADGAKLPPALVDQGEEDTFLEEQLQTWRLEEIVKERGLDARIRRQPGYDHSYWFISTFMEDHLRFLAQHL
jgi:S-formylglutathione hydrolase